jgi:N-acetylmuramoyl-L-alanine amidase
VDPELTDGQIFALTLWAEGRGEPIEGRIAIACVIRNRMFHGKWGDTYGKVCLAPYQFSCWRPQGGLENYKVLQALALKVSKGEPTADPIYLECTWVARGIMDEVIRDRVKGATHYYSPEGMIPRDRVPSWALGLEPVAIIGRHLFFKGVK